MSDDEQGDYGWYSVDRTTTITATVYVWATEQSAANDAAESYWDNLTIDELESEPGANVESGDGSAEAIAGEPPSGQQRIDEDSTPIYTAPARR